MELKKARMPLRVGARELSLSSPDRIYWPKPGITKLELVEYYLAVADGALRGCGGRPNVMKRFVKGVEGEAFFQKRAPKSRPGWLDTVTLRYSSRRTAEEVVPREPADLAWLAGQGCLDLNPHPVRAEDLAHPDELRVDLDPMPGVSWPQILEVAGVVEAVLGELGLVGWPKTSGSRGVHVNVRIAPRWTYPEVRRAAQALAREVATRAPTRATAAWWKEEREGVFLDFNQNAKDRTVASAYSVRPVPDARVSMPLPWAELYECDPADFTLRTVRERFLREGDAHAGIDEAVGDLGPLLQLHADQVAAGADDGPPRAKDGSGRRVPRVPLIEIARAKKKEDALAGLERWKARHPEVVAHLAPRHVLVDAMRGRYSLWTRIRINLEAVPEAIRPPQEALEVDYDPSVEWRR